MYGVTCHTVTKFYLCCRQEIGSEEELTDEYLVVKKVISHLLSIEKSLIVVEFPAKKPNESEQQYRNREKRERKLALNPNFSEEV